MYSSILTFLQLMYITSLSLSQITDMDRNCKKNSSRLGGEELRCQNMTSITFRKIDYWLNKTHFLTCQNCNLPALEENLFKFPRNYINYLFLIDSNISYIKNNTFQNLKLLKVLSVQNNRIENIEPGSFYSIKKLVQLDLSHNLLRILVNNLFIDTTNLDILNLNYNRIFYIQPEAFNGLTYLKYLYINNNCLKRLDENIFKHVTSLKVLHIQNNQIIDLNPMLFQNLQNLNFLYANNNSISNLVQYNFKYLTGLVDLQLRTNNLTVIETSAFNGLRNLRSLHLGENNISLVNPYGFVGLNSLQVLDLGNNDLECFSLDYVKELNSLSLLWLNDNKMENLTIDSNLQTKSHLVTLDVSGNNLTFLDYKLIYEKFPLIDNIYVWNNSWNCDVLSKMYTFLEPHNIRICVSQRCDQNSTENFIQNLCISEEENIDYEESDFNVGLATAGSSFFETLKISNYVILSYVTLYI